MCGVIGLVYEKAHATLGQTAAELLKTLEYRGYDSTGAAIQGDTEEVWLAKGVGAPSEMVHRLGIVEQGGRILCGQVRWATFGAVDDLNAQPHVVRCRTFIYGAHNGNVTNCDALKQWLSSEGHQVVSDNDGEMVVHAIEHAFERELTSAGTAVRRDPETRRRAMRVAIASASRRIEGSFSAVVVDPVTGTLWAIKLGSSLYFGLGEDGAGGRFAVASSDLTSVLKLTSTLVQLFEGEFVQFDPGRYAVYALPERDGDGIVPLPRELERPPVKSRLRAEDTELRPPFRTFMEQEIADQESTVRHVLSQFAGDGGDPRDREFCEGVERFVSACREGLARGGRILVTSCGSSFHAAKAAAIFFNEVARVGIIPALPGEFRGQYARSLADGDVVVAISQSGETKDLIDVMNDVIASRRAVRRIGLVNNLNSTLAHEKCEVVLPLLCGPEVAVPATKSFLAQVAVLYGLAIELALRRGDASVDEARRRKEGLREIPSLLRATLDGTLEAVDDVAKALFLCPSLHILATRISPVALEGALKIREVVLNHAQGYEGSEFKHGPNTILGVNTVYGPKQVHALLREAGEALGAVARESVAKGLDPLETERRVRAAGEGLLSRHGALSALYEDYPLIYVTGPDERDVALTVSQIHTHKIRGSTTIVIAEDDEALRTAASTAPGNRPDYRWAYIPLPRTGDTLLTVFTATLVLQRLALRMCERKMEYLDALGIQGHGVHPDTPKNVSKSITVD